MACMETPMDERTRIEREIRARATRRVGMKVGFAWHLFLYVLVNAGLAAINLTHDASYLWFLWPMGGWGAGLAMHAFGAFQVSGHAERMIEDEVQRELAKRGLGRPAG